MAFKLGPRSLLNLRGVHPDLVRVVTTARGFCPFIVLEGLRNVERQAKLVQIGASRTRNTGIRRCAQSSGLWHLHAGVGYGQPVTGHWSGPD